MGAKMLFAKTALDGHWRGSAVVTRALRDAGFEVVLLGMARASEIAEAAIQEDADIIGLNVGGRIEVVLRILDRLEEAGVTAPVMAGGTIPPQAKPILEERGVEVFPPGSALDDIVAAALRLVGRAREPNGVEDDKGER
jgi:methylmalonyl-CoA mutase, C-terminal domain